jgi:hypothetical protein
VSLPVPVPLQQLHTWPPGLASCTVAVNAVLLCFGSKAESQPYDGKNTKQKLHDWVLLLLSLCRWRYAACPETCTNFIVCLPVLSQQLRV